MNIVRLRDYNLI